MSISGSAGHIEGITSIESFTIAIAIDSLSKNDYLEIVHEGTGFLQSGKYPRPWPIFGVNYADLIITRSILKRASALREWGLFAGIIVISPATRRSGLDAIVISASPSMIMTMAS